MLTFCSFILTAASIWASEIGVFVGDYSRDSDIERLEKIVSPGTWTSGERSYATYLGLSLAHKFIIPIFELEHTFGAAFGADKSAKPNSFIYSSNLHFILPVDLMRVKPFVGAGLGYAYNFGEKAGLEDVAGFLGSGSFLVNLGGGTKVKLSDALWLRLTLRDYIMPNFKKALVSAVSGSSIYSTVKKSTHNISFSAGIAFNY